MLNRFRVVVAVLAFAPAFAATTACGTGCAAEVRVDPVELTGTDLELSALVTDDGDPVAGVVVEFAGTGPNGGIVVGDATSGADGVAHLFSKDGLGPDSIRGRDADTWTTYQARVSTIQSDDAAADTICAERAEAPFRYAP